MMPSEDIAAAWRLAYARQAASDFEVYDLLCVNPGIDECQRMHYLQMALEKAAKAHYWSTSGIGLPDSKVNRSHRVAEKFLSLVIPGSGPTRAGGARRGEPPRQLRVSMGSRRQ